MLARQTQSPRHRRRRKIPDLFGPAEFQPNEPVRVHVVADEETLEDGGHVEGDRGPLATEQEEGGKNLKVPPPAYGLWRSSVVRQNLNPFCFFINTYLRCSASIPICCTGLVSSSHPRRTYHEKCHHMPRRVTTVLRSNKKNLKLNPKVKLTLSDHQATSQMMALSMLWMHSQEVLLKCKA